MYRDRGKGICDTREVHQVNGSSASWQFQRCKARRGNNSAHQQHETTALAGGSQALRQAGGLSRVLAVVFRAIRVRRIGSLVDSARAEGGDGSALGPAEHRRSIEEGNKEGTVRQVRSWSRPAPNRSVDGGQDAARTGMRSARLAGRHS